MGRPQRSSARKRKQPGSDDDNGGGGGAAEGTADPSPTASDQQRDADTMDVSEPSDGPPGPGEEAATTPAAAPPVAKSVAAAAAASAPSRRRPRKSSAPAAAAGGGVGLGSTALDVAASPGPDGDGTSRQRATRQKNVKYVEDKVEYEWERDAYKDDGGGKRRRSGKGRDKDQADTRKADEDDAWDTHCKVCASDEDAQKLLCCDGLQQLGCTAVYHMYCLDPPLTRLPAGDWYCPECSHRFSYQDIEKVLDYRDTLTESTEDVDSPSRSQQRERGAGASRPGLRSGGAEEGREGGTKAEGPTRRRREYYVKWKGESHLHCTWEAEEDLGKMYRMFPAIKAKVQRFWKLRESREMEEREAEEAGEYVHGVNPLWLEVDRILAEQPSEQPSQQGPSSTSGGSGGRTRGGGSNGNGTGGGGAGGGGGGGGGGGSGNKKGRTTQMEYLVKWKDLGYDQCTWELESDISGYEAAIQRFREARSIIEDARARKAAAAVSAAKDPREAAPTRKRPKKEDGGGTGSPTGALGRVLNTAATTTTATTTATTTTTTTTTTIGSSRQQDEVQVQGSGSRKWRSTPDFLCGGSLHPYQLEGLNWLYHKYRTGDAVILADEMGLGKTVQTIAFLASLHAEYCDLPHLVVVPLSTMRNWEREFAAWAPDLNVVSLAGNVEARGIILEYELFLQPHSGNRQLGIKKGAGAAAAADEGEAGGKGDGGGGGGGRERDNRKRMTQQERAKFHVLLTSYEMLALEAGPLSKLQYSVLVVDEGHRLKNKDSKLFQLLTQFDVRHKVLLTGTPLQNHLGELFMLLHFLEPDKFPSRAAFESRFASLSQNEEVSQLHALLQPHMLRRLKKDVMKQLPPKMEQLVRVELSPRQKEIYKSLLLQHSSVLVGQRAAVAAAGGGTTALKNLMMELRKACNHPFLVDHVPGKGRDCALRHPTDLDSLITFSGKLQLVDKMALKLKEAGHRLIIFSQFTRTLDLLEEWLVGRGLGYLRIDGTVPGSERQKRIDRFNLQPEAYFCFLLSTRAGGLGINLATADTVIIFDSDWNPHNDLQAQARAHRLGQEKPVMIYRLVTRQTIEERMMQVSRKKMMLEHLVVRKMSSGAGGELKQSELDDILRYGAQELFADGEAEEAKGVKDTRVGRVSDGGAAGAGAEAGAKGGDVHMSSQGEDGTAAEAGGKEEAESGKASEAPNREQSPAADGAAAAATKSKRIVWDDAAVERLLDRQSLNAMRNYGESSAADQAAADLFSAFKVANFDMVEVVPEVEAAAEEAAAQPQTGGQAEGQQHTLPDKLLQELCPEQEGEAGPTFWQGLLQRCGAGDLAKEEEAAVEQLLAEQQRLLGKGRRERKKISYRDAAGENDSDSDQSYSQSRSRSSSDSELLEDEPDLDGKTGKRSRPVASPGPPPTSAAQEGADGVAGPAAATPSAAACAVNGVFPGSGPLLARGGAVTAAAMYGKPGMPQLAARALGNAAAACQPLVIATGPPPMQLPPLMSGNGPTMLVYGLTVRDRQTFITALMRFGLQVSESNPDDMYAAFAQRLPHRPPSYVREYCNLLIRCISEPLGASGTWSNGLRPDDLLGAHRAHDVLERIGFLHLVRRKMAEYRGRSLHGHPGKPDFELPCAARVRYLAYSNHWRPHHDGSLLHGLLLYGYGQWQRIIKDSSLGLKEPLRRELGIPVDYDSQVPQSALAAAAAGAATVDGGALKPEAAVKSEAIKDEGAPSASNGTAELASQPEPVSQGEQTDAAAVAADEGTPRDGAAVAAPAPAAAAGPEGTTVPASLETKQTCGPAAAGPVPTMTKERARGYANNESRWLTRRLSYISEALNHEYLSNPNHPIAVAALKLAPRSHSAATASAAASAGTQHTGASGGPGTGRAPGGSAGSVTDAFLSNLLPLSDFPSLAAAGATPSAERALKRQLLEQYNGLVRAVSQVRHDAAQVASRAMSESMAVSGPLAAARFRQQMGLLEALTAQMQVMMPPQGQTMAEAAPGLLARIQQAAVQQQQRVGPAAAATATNKKASAGVQGKPPPSPPLPGSQPAVAPVAPSAAGAAVPVAATGDANGTAVASSVATVKAPAAQPTEGAAMAEQEAANDVAATVGNAAPAEEPASITPSTAPSSAPAAAVAAVADSPTGGAEEPCRTSAAAATLLEEDHMVVSAQPSPSGKEEVVVIDDDDDDDDS